MIVGRRISNALGGPAPRLRADNARRADCLKCTRGCPMSLDVHRMVQAGRMENSECILCGSCIDACSRQAITYTFSTPRAARILPRPGAPANTLPVGNSIAVSNSVAQSNQVAQSASAVESQS
jgi:polyferredoxin